MSNGGNAESFADAFQNSNFSVREEVQISCLPPTLFRTSQSLTFSSREKRWDEMNREGPILWAVFVANPEELGSKSGFELLFWLSPGSCGWSGLDWTHPLLQSSGYSNLGHVCTLIWRSKFQVVQIQWAGIAGISPSFPQTYSSTGGWDGVMWLWCGSDWTHLTIPQCRRISTGG